MAKLGHIQKSFITGNSVTWAVPANQSILVTGIYVHLASTSTVGNRLLEFQILDASSSMVWNTRSAYDQAAGSDQFAMATPSGYHVGDQNRQFTSQPLPNPCIIPGGFTIKLFDRANVDAADTFETAIWYTNLDR